MDLHGLRRRPRCASTGARWRVSVPASPSSESAAGARPGGEDSVSPSRYGARPGHVRPGRPRRLGGAHRRRPRGSPAERAATWFPCNDRPADKATYRIAVAHRLGLPRRLQRRAQPHGAGSGARTTWVLRAARAHGDLPGHPPDRSLRSPRRRRTRPIAMSADARPKAAARPSRRASVGQAQMIEVFAEPFGPYPFDAYAVVITEDPLEIPLEAQGMAIFGVQLPHHDWHSGAAGRPRAGPPVVRELASPPRRWRDIWLHEGFACYAEWLWSEESGGPPAQDAAPRTTPGSSPSRRTSCSGDPGPDAMFDDRVYERGASHPAHPPHTGFRRRGVLPAAADGGSRSTSTAPSSPPTSRRIVRA